MLLEIALAALLAFNVLVLVYFVLLHASQLTLCVLAFRALRRYWRRLNSLDVDELVGSAGAPPVTVLLPVHNEAANVTERVQSLLRLAYPEYEIVVINDGSTDQTLERLTAEFALESSARPRTASLPTSNVRDVLRSRRHPNLWIVDKEAGGRADALNAGLNLCHTPIFCALDTGGTLEREGLMRLVRPFLQDRATVAASGIARIANGCSMERGVVRSAGLPRGRLARLQAMEYLRVFLAGRMGWSALDALLSAQGAFGTFRRSVVVDAGGYATDTAGEDVELVIRLHRQFLERGEPYRIAFVAEPVGWAECPESLRELGRERARWQRGLLESLARHRKMLLSRAYGRIGMVAYPYFWFLEGVGPAIEFLGYIALVLAITLGLVTAPFILTFVFLAIVLGVALSLAAVALDELIPRGRTTFADFLRLLALGVLENLGYRQLLSFWKMRAGLALAVGQRGAPLPDRHPLSSRYSRTDSVPSGSRHTASA